MISDQEKIYTIYHCLSSAIDNVNRFKTSRRMKRELTNLLIPSLAYLPSNYKKTDWKLTKITTVGEIIIQGEIELELFYHLQLFPSGGLFKTGAAVTDFRFKDQEAPIYGIKCLTGLLKRDEKFFIIKPRK